MKSLILVGSVTGGPIVAFAQTAPDPISGGAGWVGAGLLGLVLSWLLLVHLPAKDKQLKEFTDARDADAAATRDTFLREQREQRAAFVAEQVALRDANSREQGELRSMLIQAMQSMRVAVHDVKDTAQATINQVAAVQAQKDKH